MTHEQARRRLGPLLEGELTIRERAELVRHLEACPDCNGEARALRTTRELLRSLPDPELPRDLSGIVVERIRAGEGRPGWWARTLSSLGRGLGVPLTVPAATAAIGVGAFLMSSAPEAPGPQAPTPRAPSRQAAASSPVVGVAQASAERFGDSFALCRAALPTSANSPQALIDMACANWFSEMLALADSAPADFLRRVEMLPPHERDNWLDGMVRFAGRRGGSQRVAAELRSLPDAFAWSLAERFEGALPTRTTRILPPPLLEPPLPRLVPVANSRRQP